MANIFPGIQIPTNNPIPNPIIPSQQVVVPSVTIPQGFSAVPNQAIERPITSIIVHGKEAAKNYQLPPGSRVAIFDDDESMFYYRETDERGNTISFKTCSYEEIEDPPEPQYLTVQEFKAALSDFAKELKEELSNG